MIYLIKDEKRNGTYFKVGYTSNLAKRMKQYHTHNADIVLLETIETKAKTKHQLETAIHEELTQMGYTFKLINDGTLTEWFFVDIDHEREFETAGLAQFKSCKGRKIYI